jgi:hypothetical protein
MTSAIQISPKNDINIVVGPLMSVSSLGAKAPITSGTVTGFFATSKATSAIAADPSLQANLSYIGAQSDGEGGTYDEGSWLFQLNASDAVAALLATYFSNARPFLIVTRTDDLRVVIPCEYVESLIATVDS